MLASLLIVFRESLEAGLVIGIVLAAMRDVPRHVHWTFYGVFLGLLGSFFTAFFAGQIASLLSGMGQEAFNALVLFLAGLMLMWHTVWMKREGRFIALEMRALGHDVAIGKKTLLTLTFVIALSVLREGSEVVLFLYGVAISGGTSTLSMLFGGVLGIFLGGFVTITLYFGLIHIPSRLFFSTTTCFITFLAAGMTSQAVFFLQQGGFISVLTNPVWNSSFLVASDSLLGKALNTLLGYTDQPTGAQLLVYACTLLLTVSLLKIVGHKPPPLAHQT